MLLINSIHGFTQSFSLTDYLDSIQPMVERKFFFKHIWTDSAYVTPASGLSVEEIIELSIKEYGLKLYLFGDQYGFIYPNQIELQRTFQSLDLDIRDRAFSFRRIGDPGSSQSDEVYTLSGQVTDEFGQPLLGVNVAIDNQILRSTDENGTYLVDLTPGNYEISFSYAGREDENWLISFYSQGSLDISLLEGAQVLDEIIVKGQTNDAGLRSEAGAQKLSLAKLEKLPSFLGDVDVVKSATALPGVSVSGESSAYLNVRGGRNDQTMVLMNKTSIYNPGHLLGFFSVFNGDFVSSMTLFKGNIPAKYGMRASSVLDVTMNKWATKKLNIYGGLGIANSNVGVKTKLIDNKLDIHIGGRISYVGWLLDFVPNRELVESKAQFRDTNVSARYLLDNNNSFYLSGFYGADFFRYADQIVYEWTTANAGFRWNHLFTNGWVLESEVLASQLSNQTENLVLNDEFLFENGISETGFKSTLSTDKLEVGVDISNYSINAGKISPRNSSGLVIAEVLDKERLLNAALHASYLLPFGEYVEVKPGVRVGRFANYGPVTVPVYERDTPYQPENVLFEERITKGKSSFNQNSLEPRLGLTYRRNSHTVRLGYSRVNQFLHLIANTTLINPTAIWKGTDRYIPRTAIDQYSAGYQRELKDGEILISLDGFYKKMDQAIEYRDGAELILNERLEQDILIGEGEAFGVEFQLAKNVGKLSGFMNYSYTRSFITVNDELQNVRINNGERYPYYSDRPHNFKAYLDYEMTKKWTLSANFTFFTGAPISLPTSVLTFEGKQVPLFTERNSNRMPDYHRLDLVVTLKNRTRITKKNSDRWVLTLYNVYGRDNVATIFFASQDDLPTQSFSLINVGNIVPTLTYKFEF